VPDAQQYILKDAAAATKASDKQGLLQLAHSSLVFPSKSDYAKLHRYRVLSKSEQTVWNSIFQPIYQS
jgi:spermidine/putrescine transport system substrate-binding protein